MKCRIILLLQLVGSSAFIYAQDLLTFDKALELTLANNYDIQLASVNEEIADNNSSLSNNNYLPTLSAAGNYNWTYYGGKNFLANETRTFDPNRAYNYGGSVTASYTLFEGMGRRYRYKQSQVNLKFSQLQLEQIIQTTILELSRLFHEVGRLEESVSNFEKALEISKTRLQRATYNYEYGQANKLEMLNAKVDLNNDSITLITAVQDLENQKRNLNYVMGQEVDTDLTVDVQVNIKENIVLEEVIAGSEERNLDLRIAESNLQMNRYAIGDSKSAWLPRIDANAGYLYNGNENPNSPFLIGSQSSGPQAGLTLSWNLFNGRNNMAIQNAKLNLQSREIEQQSMEQRVRSEALNAYNTYRNSLFILRAQADNLSTAKDNFDRSQSAYQLGQINSIDFRLAQLNLLNAAQALSKAKYDAKNAELRVLAVMGSLVEK